MSAINIKNKTINGDLFFYGPISCLFLLSFLTYLNLTENTELFGYYAYQQFFAFFRSMKPLFLILLLVKIAFFSRYTWKELAMIGVLLISVYFMGRFCHPNYFLLYALAACLAARHVPYKSIAKLYLALAVFTLLLTIAFLLYGLTSDIFVYRGNSPRHSLGLVHPNSLGMWALLITVYYLQYKKNECKWYCYLFLAALIAGFFLLTNSRASFLFAFLAMALSLLCRYIKQPLQKPLRIILLAAILSLATLWTITVFFYDPESPFLALINKFSSGRLLYCHQAMTDFPVTAFGSTRSFHHIVDPLFTYTLMKYGIVGLALFLLMFYAGAIRAHRRNLTFILIAILIFQLYNTQENVFLYHLFDLTMFTATCDLDQC